MSEIRSAIFARIHKPEDFKVANDSPLYNEIVIHSDQGDLVLAIPQEYTLQMSMDLAKAEAGRIKQDLSQKVHVVAIFEQAS